MAELLKDRAYEITCLTSVRLKVSAVNSNWGQAVMQPLPKNEVLYGTYVDRNTGAHVFWIPDMNQFVAVPYDVGRSIKVSTSCGVKESVYNI